MNRTLLVSDAMEQALAARFDAIAADCGTTLHRLPLSQLEADDGRARLASVTAAWFSRDQFTGVHSSRPGASLQRFFAAVDAAPNLEWLHVMSAGTDIPLYRPSIERGVVLTTASGTTAVPIAQTVVAALLAHARGFPRWLDSQARRAWEQRLGPEAPADLAGQTALIVGLGPIGLETARLLRAFGLRTVGVRRSASPSPGVDVTITYDGIDAWLPACDWLILCCPLSSLTRGLIGARRLAMLPRHARLINVGRGRLVEQDALVDALRERRIAGAYLDVFDTEPLPADSPLWALPDVWISPHNAATSQGNAARDVELFLANLRRWLGGLPLANATER